jgi:hypothetical protein
MQHKKNFTSAKNAHHFWILCAWKKMCENSRFAFSVFVQKALKVDKHEMDRSLYKTYLDCKRVFT